MSRLVASEIKIISQFSVFQCSYIFGNTELADGSHELHLEIEDVECMSITELGYDGKIHGLRIVAYCPKLVEGYKHD